MMIEEFETTILHILGAYVVGAIITMLVFGHRIHIDAERAWEEDHTEIFKCKYSSHYHDKYVNSLQYGAVTLWPITVIGYFIKFIVTIIRRLKR